jgi:hypothetical protein
MAMCQGLSLELHDFESVCDQDTHLSKAHLYVVLKERQALQCLHAYADARRCHLPSNGYLELLYLLG